MSNPSTRSESVALDLPIRTLDDTPRGLVWLLLLQTGLPTFLLYQLLTADNSMPVTHVFMAWVFMWPVQAVAIFIGYTLRKPRAAMVSALVLSVCMCIVWAGYSESVYAVWVFPVFMAAVLYRMHRFIAGSFVNDENRLAFRWDCGLVIAGLLAIAILLGTHSVGFTWSCFDGVVAIFVRLFTMWKLERTIEKSQGASMATWVWILVCLLVLLVFGPTVAYYLSITVGYALAVVVSPLTFLLPANWHLPPPPPKPKNPNSPDNMLYASAPVEHQSTYSIFSVVLAVAFVVVLIVFITRAVRNRNKVPKEVVDAVLISRSWVHDDKDLRFLPTKHPVRLEIQRWLKEEFKKGNRIQPHETIPQFVERLLKEGSIPGHMDNRQGAARNYEHVRYREEEGRSRQTP